MDSEIFNISTIINGSTSQMVLDSIRMQAMECGNVNSEILEAPLSLVVGEGGAVIRIGLAGSNWAGG
jgi:hypothetical protein